MDGVIRSNKGDDGKDNPQCVYPLIYNISDVLPYIDPDYFSVSVNEQYGYTVVNYNFMSPEVFPNLSEGIHAYYRREFRGLIFDTATGNILRRPFHKFFNLGEREETSVNNIFGRDHVIFEKADGSMIVPWKNIADGNRQLLWGTKAGVTDVSGRVNVPENYIKLANDLLDFGWNPIFEFCSRKQRIVLDYPEDRLILLAVRNIHTGEYMSLMETQKLAHDYSVEHIKTFSDAFGYSFIDSVRNMEDSEGVVVKFTSSGELVKIKSDWYVGLHRVKAQIAKESGVVSLLVSDSIDDLKPLLLKADRERLEDYETMFWLAFSNCVRQSEKVLEYIRRRNMTRKQFALEMTFSKESEFIRPLVFKLFDTDDDKLHGEIQAYLKDFVSRSCVKTKSFQDIRKTIFFDNVPEWTETYL